MDAAARAHLLVVSDATAGAASAEAWALGISAVMRRARERLAAPVAVDHDRSPEACDRIGDQRGCSPSPESPTPIGSVDALRDAGLERCRDHRVRRSSSLHRAQTSTRFDAKRQQPARTSCSPRTRMPCGSRRCALPFPLLSRSAAVVQFDPPDCACSQSVMRRSLAVRDSDRILGGVAVRGRRASVAGAGGERAGARAIGLTFYMRRLAAPAGRARPTSSSASRTSPRASGARSPAPPSRISARCCSSC